MFYNGPIISGLHVHSSRPNSRAAASIYRAALLWADSFELIAGCAKLLTSLGIEYQRAFCRGSRHWRVLRSMNAKRTAEQLFRVHDSGFTVPLQASLHLSVGAFFTCGFFLTFQRSRPEPAVQPSRRLQKLNNSKSLKLGPCYTQEAVRKQYRPYILGLRFTGWSRAKPLFLSLMRATLAPRIS
jgi:hypothetical protein